MNLIELDWNTLTMTLTVLTVLGLFVMFRKANGRARAQKMLTPRQEND